MANRGYDAVVDVDAEVWHAVTVFLCCYQGRFPD